MRAVTKKKSAEAEILGVVRFTWARDTFFLTVRKRRRKEKREKVKNSVKSQSCISINATFPIEKVHFAPWDANVAETGSKRETKRKKVTRRAIFKSCTFYAGRGHIFARDKKGDKKRKREKKSKIVSRGRKIQNRPPSATKQMVLRRYGTGLYDVMLVFDQKLIKNDAFDLQKIVRNPVEF